MLKSKPITLVLLAPAWQNANWHLKAWKLVKVWPEIVHEVSRSNEPFLFEVSIKGPKVLPRDPIRNL